MGWHKTYQIQYYPLQKLRYEVDKWEYYKQLMSLNQLIFLPPVEFPQKVAEALIQQEG